ncbi:MAG: hypothetical protein PHE80_03830 [Candidatus Omnitrophica bacterium]|nr:hypothetical protein [Candidatus Omnitrophota bacterium]MDD5737767.1 hypothetical protein [Candidatus Omnitrophota bacterium]
MNRGMMLWVIWASFVAAIFLYLFIACTATVNYMPEVGVVPKPLMTIFAVESVVMAAISVAMRRYALTGLLRKGKLKPGSPEEIKRTMTVFVVAWALSEAIAILGLVLRFNGYFVKDMLYFAGFALVMLTYHAPRSSIYLGQELE